MLAAAAVLTIPYERMKAKHILRDETIDQDLTAALKKLNELRFFEAPFWAGAYPEDGVWRQSQIVTAVEHVDGWRDPQDLHPLATEAVNSIAKKGRSAHDVIRVLRNAQGQAEGEEAEAVGAAAEGAAADA